MGKIKEFCGQMISEIKCRALVDLMVERGWSSRPVPMQPTRNKTRERWLAMGLTIRGKPRVISGRPKNNGNGN